MTLKEIFKTLEGIIVLSGFGLVIFTGAKLFAWLGLILYAVVNLKNGTNLLKLIFNKITGFFKNLLGKKED